MGHWLAHVSSFTLLSSPDNSDLPNKPQVKDALLNMSYAKIKVPAVVGFL